MSLGWKTQKKELHESVTFFLTESKETKKLRGTVLVSRGLTITVSEIEYTGKGYVFVD